MKLTNQQVSALTDKIVREITEKKQKEISTLYNSKEIQQKLAEFKERQASIEVLSKALSKDIQSFNNKNKNCIDTRWSDAPEQRTAKCDNRDEISEEIILSAINTVDLDKLFTAIVKKFSK